MRPSEPANHPSQLQWETPIHAHAHAPKALLSDKLEIHREVVSTANEMAVDANEPPPAAALERFLVILADDCLPETIWLDDRETECLTMSTANVLAHDFDEAVILASQADFDGHHRPVTALTASELRTMADMLERCPFTPHRRVTYTNGGYPTVEHLERAASRDKTSSILEV